MQTLLIQPLLFCKMKLYAKFHPDRVCSVFGKIAKISAYLRCIFSAITQLIYYIMLLLNIISTYASATQSVTLITLKLLISVILNCQLYLELSIILFCAIVFIAV